MLNFKSDGGVHEEVGPEVIAEKRRGRISKNARSAQIKAVTALFV